jgi:hypothetical protein
MRLTRAKWFGPLIAAAIVAGGCGGSSGDETSATTQWFDDVCSAVTTWQQSISEVGASLKENPSKDALGSAFEDAKDATNTLTDDLRAAGKPDTQAGDQAEQTLDTLGTELDDGVAKMEDAVEGVSTVNDVLTAVSVVSDTLATMGTQIKSTVDELRGLDPEGELQSAFDQSDACAALKT